VAVQLLAPVDDHWRLIDWPSRTFVLLAENEAVGTGIGDGGAGVGPAAEPPPPQEADTKEIESTAANRNAHQLLLSANRNIVPF
jgi:hypothetical protein